MLISSPELLVVDFRTCAKMQTLPKPPIKCFTSFLCWTTTFIRHRLIAVIIIRLLRSAQQPLQSLEPSARIRGGQEGDDVPVLHAVGQVVPGEVAHLPAPVKCGNRAECVRSAPDLELSTFPPMKERQTQNMTHGEQRKTRQHLGISPSCKPICLHCRGLRSHRGGALMKCPPY